MLIEFKQAVGLRGKDASGKEYTKDFGLGLNGEPRVHDVSEEILAHPESVAYLNKLAKAGLASTPEEIVKPVAHESLAERQKRLAEKLGQDQKSKLSPESSSSGEALEPEGIAGGPYPPRVPSGVEEPALEEAPEAFKPAEEVESDIDSEDEDLDDDNIVEPSQPETKKQRKAREAEERKNKR